MKSMPAQVKTILMTGDRPDTIEMMEAILHIVQVVTPQLLEAPVETEYRLSYKCATVKMHAYVEYRSTRHENVVVWRVSMEEWMTEGKNTQSELSHIYVGDHHEIGAWLTGHIEALEKARNVPKQANYGDW
ncbi:hypothetical protein [Stenotrophomonas phage BUCTxx99]|nr:hypothetical protein [Stenotrophomonas phage BUCTxx99]